MAVTTVAQLAAELNRPAATLLEQLHSAGVPKASPADPLSDADKQKLLGYLQASHGTASPERKKPVPSRLGKGEGCARTGRTHDP